MSIRQGTRIVAGNGAVPYINNSTGNWELNGYDTGVQAIPIKLTIDQYAERVNNGTIDNTKMYYITDGVAILYRNIIIKPSDWISQNGYFVASVNTPKVRATDTVFVDLSGLLSDADYMVQYNECSNNPFIRVKVMDGSLTILVKSLPTMNYNLDISSMRCLVQG